MWEEVRTFFAFLLLDLGADLNHFVGGREPWQWFFFFFPFFVFGEFPRYILPSLLLGARQCLHRSRRHGSMGSILPGDLQQAKVSVLLVGYNEEKTVAQAIRSLLEFEWPDLEIIVVDDNSTDGMYEAARPFAEQGKIRLFKNSSATGRAGRPVASNLAFQMATGDIIVSVDADTSFDRDALEHMLAPFSNPRVGVVAGNLKPRNTFHNLLTRMQGIEYLQSITVWKTWLNVLGWNMQASGAFGAFRPELFRRCGAWDPELAEDADISLKIKKCGYKVVFAPRAVGMTTVPETPWHLIRQRIRWDRGMLRTYFRKHLDLMRFWRFDWRNCAEMFCEFVFTILLTFLYLGWLVYMLWHYPAVLLFISVVVYFLYLGAGAITLLAGLSLSERAREERPLLWSLPFFPVYKALSRWVRVYSFLLEVPRINYEDSYLPPSAWRNAPRW